MPFEFNENKKQFHLYNDHVSYIFYVMHTGVLGHIYYGKRLPVDQDYTYQKTHMDHILKVYTDDVNLTAYEDTLQEMPVYGMGDYREEAIRLTYSDGSSLNQFTYKAHEVKSGNYDDNFLNLPHSRSKSSEDATTLKLVLRDDYRQVEVELYYTLYENLPVITRYTKVVNLSKETLVLNKCLSTSLDFNEPDFRLMQFDGAWSKERHVQISDLGIGKRGFGSLKGSSSANHNPYFALLQDNADENQGCVYGISLIYSGNFEVNCEINTYQQLRAQIGIHEKGFNWSLAANESFVTPEAVMAFSPNGLNGLSQVQHNFINKHILPDDPRTKPQVLINTWETTYLDFDEEKLYDLAKESVKYGINLFVLDDGWFVGRNSDFEALGDWIVDEAKLPNGIEGISDRVHNLGMDFGLWIEPEMINLNSRLYEAHPEWVVHHEAYSMSVGRHQHILDFANKEIVDYLFDLLEKVIRKGKVDYIKWDMNRLMTEPFSQYLPKEQQGEFSHRYILGVYDLYDRLTTTFPNIVFESCSCGGNRFDLGMLYYTLQSWASDDTDPAERLRIQTGTSYLYPLKTIGAHVSSIFNHQTLRSTSLEFKSHVALFGTYGLELDLRTISDMDSALMKEHIELFKEVQPLIHNGDFIRLISPFSKDKKNHNNISSWMVVDEDKNNVIVGIYQELAKPNPNVQRLYLKGLDPNKKYKDLETSTIYYGSELMELGYILDEFFTGFFTDDKVSSRSGKGQFGSQDFGSKLMRLKAL